VIWLAVLAGAAGCYGLKLAGLSVPRRVLDDPRAQRIAVALPIALLAALIATQTLTDGRAVTVDARVVAVGVAAVAVAMRAPFLIVVVLAAGAAAALRAVA
jgi:uncharacterized membrane protein